MFCAFKVSQDALEGLLVVLARDDLPDETSDTASFDRHLVELALKTLAYLNKPENDVTDARRSESLLRLDELDHGLGSRENCKMLFDKLEHALLPLDGASDARAELETLL